MNTQSDPSRQPASPVTPRRRILVTGGAGFLGSFLCERLLAEGHDVLCVDNFFTGSRDNVLHLLDDRRFELVRHDVTFPLFVEVDQVYNLACPASPVHYQFDPVATIKTNVHGAINMLGLAKRTHARIFQASTSEVYGDPAVHPQPESYRGSVNPIGPRACYDEGKRCAETLFFDYHRQYGVDIRVARIFNTYGPRMNPNDGRVVSNFIVQALRGEPVTLYGDGEQTRSFCYVDDLIEGFVRLMATEGETGPINIGNPGEFTMRELAELVIELTGSRSEIVHRPLPQDDPTQRRPDITRARELLGWEPRVALRDGLARTIAYFEAKLSGTTAACLPERQAANWRPAPSQAVRLSLWSSHMTETIERSEAGGARFDIVIPCYNYGRFLSDAVASVLSQAVNVRVLVIDDCSQDDTPAVGLALADGDARVTFRRHAVNHGHIATYNEGIDWADGDYFAIVSADDLLMPGALARAASAFSARPELALVYGREIHFAEGLNLSEVLARDVRVHPLPGSPIEHLADGVSDGTDARVLDEAAPEAVQVIGTAEFYRMSMRANRVQPPASGTVTRTALQKRIGGYLATLPHSGDYEMWLRVAAHGPIGYLPRFLTATRRHGSNMSGGYDLVRDMLQRAEAIEELSKSCSSVLPPALLDELRRKVASDALGMTTIAIEDRSSADRQRLIDAATALDPHIARRPAWYLYLLKRALGPRLLKSVRETDIFQRARQRVLPQ